MAPFRGPLPLAAEVEEEIQEDADLEQAKEVENWGVRILSAAWCVD